MPYFSDRDRAIVEALVFDAAEEPGYEALKGCLVWRDEQPNNITNEGWDKLCDLWIARSYLHRGEPMKDQFRSAWEQAQREGIRWPGFQRVTLSANDKAYYKQMIEDGGL
ncbi:MAG: hypothetical protein LAP38_18100 [Acidobacteriia bacterium]|nr:hypothetical protein [Terriglobia bacterium]